LVPLVVNFLNFTTKFSKENTKVSQRIAQTTIALRDFQIVIIPSNLENCIQPTINFHPSCFEVTMWHE